MRLVKVCSHDDRMMDAAENCYWVVGLDHDTDSVDPLLMFVVSLLHVKLDV